MAREEGGRMSLLEVKGLGVRFGGVAALQNVDLSVAQGSVHGLIGPNGAGKTTLLNCIGRVIEPSAGAIHFAGRDLLACATHELAELGIARTFQNLALMDDRTSLDNAMVGLPTQSRRFGLSAFLPTPARARAGIEDRRVTLDALKTLGLDMHADKVVRSLPYGHRKSIEIARALCAAPRLLMLDEPTAGLHPGEMDQLVAIIRRLHRDLGLTILLITHHIDFLLKVADKVTVLDLGSVIADGPPELVQTDPRVMTAYLGTEA
jgi:ABC-type branched-subunit amino acid transport system ATPase component